MTISENIGHNSSMELKTMTETVLIPGGEISMAPAGTYTDKQGRIRPSAPKIWVTFGANRFALRIDQIITLMRECHDNDKIRRFIEENIISV
jgi:hypothetical protein